MITTPDKKASVLVVEDDQGFGELLLDEIEDMGLAAKLANTAEAALAVIEKWTPDLIVTDLRLPGADGLSLLESVRQKFPAPMPDFLIITAFGSVSKAVESLKAGAEDFLTKPLDFEHFKLCVKRILETRRLKQEINQIRTLLAEDAHFHGMYGRSSPMLDLFQQIKQIAKAGGPVLITGESGTGKELVARAIHAEGNPEKGPFLAVNCAGIPEALLESEFFGHEAGAFTGAGKARQGLFAEAEGGTLLLDEISEMPTALQVKLLRMLQDGKVRPVGSNHEEQINVRILAASNRNIEACVQDGKFRADLFYRLETFSLAVPPLRERGEDLELLAGFFLAKYASTNGKRISGFSRRALNMIHAYDFPGNVRELQNAIERAVVYCQDDEIGPEHLPSRIRRRSEPSTNDTDRLLPNSICINDDSLLTLDEVQRRYIHYVLEAVGGNKRMAASILGIARRTLYRWLDD